MKGTELYNNEYLDRTDKLISKSNKSYLEGFKWFLTSGDSSPATVYRYVTRVNNFMDTVEKDPKDLGFDDYVVYLGKLSGKTSSFRITTYAALKKFSTYLKANQTNILDPMQHIKRPKFKEDIKTTEKRKKGYLEKGEIKEMCSNIESGVGTKKAISFQKHTKERDRAIVLLFLSTGVRCSALCKLDVEDVNFEDKSIVVLDKGGKVKHYPLGNEAWQALEIWMNVRKSNDDALFVKHDGQRLGYRGVYSLIKKYASTVEGKHITPHKLRATYGTQLYNATHDIYFVQKCMGHNSATTTQLYVRGNDDEGAKASEIINSLLTD